MLTSAVLAMVGKVSLERREDRTCRKAVQPFQWAMSSPCRSDRARRLPVAADQQGGASRWSSSSRLYQFTARRPGCWRFVCMSREVSPGWPAPLPAAASCRRRSCARALSRAWSR